jgi:hypothetical protein
MGAGRMPVVFALALGAGCSSAPSPPDAALDLSVPRDLAGEDLTGADLSMPGGVQLIESSCPIDLPNGRCYWDTPPDSFY